MGGTHLPIELVPNLEVIFIRDCIPEFGHILCSELLGTQIILFTILPKRKHIQRVDRPVPC